MKRPKYPLEEIALIKQKRLEEAEKMLKEKKEHLKRELEKLATAEAKYKKALQHKYDKIRKHIAEMEEGTTSDKIQLHQHYIKKVVEEELKEEEKRVKAQKEVVKIAEEEVEKSRQEYLKKTQEMEKMRLHKEEWKQEMMREEIKQEASDTDEIGSTIDSLRRKKKLQG